MSFTSIHTEEKNTFRSLVIAAATHAFRIAAIFGGAYLIGYFLSDKIVSVLLERPVFSRLITGLFFILLAYALYHIGCVASENMKSKRKSVNGMPLTIADIRDRYMNTPWDYCFAMNYYFTYPRLPLLSFTPNYYPAYVHNVRCWELALDNFERLFGRLPVGSEIDKPFDWMFWAKNEVRQKLNLQNDSEIEVPTLRRVLSKEMLQRTGITLRESAEVDA